MRGGTNRIERGYSLPGRLRVKGSVVGSLSGVRAQPRLKTKTILVLSKRDETPLVADFTRFLSDIQRTMQIELAVIHVDFVQLRSELKILLLKVEGVTCPSVP